MTPDCPHHRSLLTDEVLSAFDALPPELFDTAVGMYVGVLHSARSAGMTPGEIAAIIAGPFFRPVLEDERRLNALPLTRAS